MIYKNFLAVCFITIVNVNCLFEDQAGTYDWRQQYVGKPLYSHIDTNSKRLYLATDQHVLATLNLKTGSIIWRKILESNEAGKIDYVLWSEKEFVVISNQGQRIQSFDYAHGFANWEYTMFNLVASSVIDGIESRNERETYFFTNGHQACSVSEKDKSCVSLPSDGFVYNKIFETEQGVFVVGTKENLIQKLQFNSLLSSLVSKSISTENDRLRSSRCIKSAGSNDIVCFSDEAKTVVKSEIKAGERLDINEVLASKTVFIESKHKTQLKWSSKDTFVVETLSESSINENIRLLNVYIFKQVQSEKELVLLKKLESVLAYEVVYRQSGDSYYLVYSKILSGSKLNLYTVELSSGNERSDAVVSINMAIKEPKSIVKLQVRLVEGKGGQLSLISLIFFEDYSLSVFSGQGVRYFVREEALAYITSVEMVDLPLLHLQEEFEDEFGSSAQSNILTMFYNRIRMQIIQLKEFMTIELFQRINSLLNNEGFTVPSSKIQSSAEISVNDLKRDEFNLNQLIVAATSVGKVFGIYTGANGRILWSFYLKNTQPFKLSNKREHGVHLPLFLQRSSAHVPHEAQCTIVSRVQVGETIKTRVFFFNPLTGKVSKDFAKEGLVLDYEVKQAFLFNLHDSHFLKPLVLFDTENRIHVFPEKAVKEIESKSSKATVIFSTIRENNSTSGLVGYSMKSINKPLSEVWRINLEDEEIVSIAAKLANDRIHSQGKVLGDRSVLYKYLNPNMVGVVTTGHDGQNVPFINVYLVDTVTGTIITSFSHKRCKGPVNIVHSENWFFYSYYNIKYRRFEVSSVELFEGSTQFNSTHFSSMNDVKPVVFSKSYITQKSFDAMQVTLTEKGISTKDVIVACQFGVIIEIPSILIDARRPVKMTEVEREENLIPYMPEIPLNYEFSLNYYNYVYNIRGITTAPSGLESTSLVFVYGLDIFFTRVFPSKTFDMLREDFDYFFIITLMVGLLAGTFLSKKLASSSNLKKAWK